MAETKEQILRGLYDALEVSWEYLAHGESSPDSAVLRKYLFRAKDVGLRWKDVYNLHKSRVDKRRQSRLSEIIKEEIPLEALFLRDNKLILKFPGDELILDSRITLGEIYEFMNNHERLGITREEIAVKFPQNKIIGPEDYGKAKFYFKNNADP